MPVSLDDVQGAYRFILGREPESDEVVARHQLQADNFDALRFAFLSSEEYRSQAKPVSLLAPPQAIETAADSATLRAMIAKTAAAWEAR